MHTVSSYLHLGLIVVLGRGGEASLPLATLQSDCSELPAAKHVQCAPDRTLPSSPLSRSPALVRASPKPTHTQHLPHTASRDWDVCLVSLVLQVLNDLDSAMRVYW